MLVLKVYWRLWGRVTGTPASTYKNFGIDLLLGDGHFCFGKGVRSFSGCVAYHCSVLVLGGTFIRACRGGVLRLRSMFHSVSRVRMAYDSRNEGG